MDIKRRQAGNRIAGLFVDSDNSDNWHDIADEALEALTNGEAIGNYFDLALGLRILRETTQVINDYGTNPPDKLLRIPVYRSEGQKETRGDYSSVN
ncbi:hypothetical protein J4462_00695 [Candidatus Pacearchaeota archaeon]|nr:hypothetical protein [Candidatus Pacearchaeota archaeon]